MQINMGSNTEKKYILAKYDVSGIQEYIFATNRLTENIGASRIVSRVLKQYLCQAVEKAKKKDTEVFTEWKSQPFRMSNRDRAMAEVIYIGGGNALVAYRDKDIYNEASRILAEEFITVSSTLTLITAFIETNFDDYKADCIALDRELATVKLRQPRYSELSSYPIIEQETTYGLPVACRDRETERGISLVQWQKQKAFQDKTGDEEPSVLPEGIVETFRMDELVDPRGTDSYVAVIHIDGNGMGAGIKKKLEECGSDYEKAVPEHRALSARISELYESVYGQMIRWISN